jgi:hypothetical protein
VKLSLDRLVGANLVVGEQAGKEVYDEALRAGAIEAKKRHDSAGTSWYYAVTRPWG